MKIVMFYHSLVSDWNHGNAHFLRGVASELIRQGHDVTVYEPAAGWSRSMLLRNHGDEPIRGFHAAYPELKAEFYQENFDPAPVVAKADLVIVHEWNDHLLVKRIGNLRQRHPFVLLFHDTHHRMVTDPAAMESYDLSGYDGVLAFGEVLKDLYLSRRLTRHAWTWHEAADTSRFHPVRDVKPVKDLVWIGNWGDDERSAEIHEFLIDPARELGLSAAVHGVRYPDAALKALKRAGIEYKGWLSNHRVPEVFASYRLTVHIPRRAYVEALPGIPTIRPFEALACGIPLISAPWNDAEQLFTPGRDYLIARNGEEMKSMLSSLLADEARRESMARQGLDTIHERHSCARRVDELLDLVRKLRPAAPKRRHQPLKALET